MESGRFRPAGATNSGSTRYLGSRHSGSDWFLERVADRSRWFWSEISCAPRPGAICGELSAASRLVLPSPAARQIGARRSKIGAFGCQIAWKRLFRLNLVT